MNQLLIALAIAASGFFGGWTVHSWKQGSEEKVHVQEKLVETVHNYENAIRKWDNVLIAQDAASSREVRLRRDLADSRAGALGLSHAADAALRAAAESQGACLATAATFKDLFETVSGERRELAEAADRHVSDIRLLNESWPINQPKPYDKTNDTQPEVDHGDHGQ